MEAPLIMLWVVVKRNRERQREDGDCFNGILEADRFFAVVAKCDECFPRHAPRVSESHELQIVLIKWRYKTAPSLIKAAFSLVLLSAKRSSVPVNGRNVRLDLRSFVDEPVNHSHGNPLGINFVGFAPSDTQRHNTVQQRSIIALLHFPPLLPNLPLLIP